VQHNAPKAWILKYYATAVQQLMNLRSLLGGGRLVGHPV